ncbi:MAG TPA: hypothetical protein VHF26_17020 [Trebonia sp.]|nr:hypothetical protein [Trebonia sp.]
MESPGSTPSAQALPGDASRDAPVPDSPLPDGPVPNSTAPDTSVPDSSVQETPGTDPARAAATGPVWRFLIEPRWLGWHLFAVVAVWGMAWLCDWQLHRALGGNGLSWAYTFEWPLFAGFGIVFWARTIRDEFRLRRGVPVTGRSGQAPSGPALPAGLGMREIQQPGDDADDAELASYNAYLAKLNAEVKGHNKWLGRN